MAFQKKAPPIKLTLDDKFYNLLLEVLTKNEKIEVEQINEKATILKEKLLKYGSPYITEDGNKMVKLGFFNKEASNMIDQFLVFIALNNEVEIETDYYSVLQKVRETNRANKEE